MEEAGESRQRSTVGQAFSLRRASARQRVSADPHTTKQMEFTRRHLPHLYAAEQPLFITFRLHGSLPAGREFPKISMTSGKAFVCMDRLLDNQQAGPTYLRMPGIAHLVANAIEQGGASNYLLHAWVIMPNHVHLLITPLTNVSHLLRKLKGATAREANKLLNRTGTPFWQDESYDRLVRNPEECRKIRNYIVQNPVKAGLAASAEEFPWSSASRPNGLKPFAGSSLPSCPVESGTVRVPR